MQGIKRRRGRHIGKCQQAHTPKKLEIKTYILASGWKMKLSPPSQLLIAFSSFSCSFSSSFSPSTSPLISSPSPLVPGCVSPTPAAASVAKRTQLIFYCFGKLHVVVGCRVGHADIFADAHRCGYPHYPTYVRYSASYADNAILMRISASAWPSLVDIFLGPLPA